MSLTSGWFNSFNGDRRYYAEQMSAIFNGIISDGVFPNEGSAFAITADTGNTVNVGIGRCWFNNIWVYNDAILPLTLTESGVLTDRIDAIVIEINHNKAVRAGTIKVVTGTASSTPKAPAMVNTDNIHQHPLAYIYRAANTSEITQDNITYLVGTKSCPFVSGVVDINATYSMWKTLWDSWFNSVKDLMSGDVATDMANRIVGLEAAAHRRLFRGKNLGTGATTEQLEAIRNGTFDDIWLGDYWVRGNVIYRVVDFDYWYGCGGDGTDNAFNKHHLVIMPDTVIKQGVMYSDTSTTNWTNEGYVGSEMYTSDLYGVRTAIENAFGSLILTHREYFVNHVDIQYGPDAGAWYDSTVDLPNQIMMYGSSIHRFTPLAFNSGQIMQLQTIDKTQLALFAARPEFIIAGYSSGLRQRQWLRDAVHHKQFAFIDDNGDASLTKATNSRGIRPVFAIG